LYRHRLKGLPATTYWAVLNMLENFGAQPVAERFVEHGKIITAAGVSAGIDMALWLVGKLAAQHPAYVNLLPLPGIGPMIASAYLESKVG